MDEAIQERGAHRPALEDGAIIRPLNRSGDLGWMVMAHGEVYAQEFGWALFARLIMNDSQPAWRRGLNTVLGEELLSRGYMLPRMKGVFGSRDWVANGVLFAVYHLHVPWVIPIALIDTFILSLPSRRYQSALVGVIAHSVQSVFLFALVLMLFLTS